MPDINRVWERIKSHKGEEFKTKRGEPFTYTVRGDVLNPSRTDYNLAKSQFAQALSMVPFDGPGKIQHLRGPSYIWGILHDDRIRKNEW